MGGPTYKHDALRACERDGDDCVVFAYRRDILVDYEVEKATATTTQAPAQTASVTPTVKPVMRISSSLRQDIEQYLANSKTQTENYRFLALNKAGDKLGLSTSCKIKKSGWGGWTAEGCGFEPQAQRLALDKCGSSDCRIIYRGDQQVGSFDIDWY